MVERKAPEELVKEKMERIERSIELKEPDKVPLSISTCGDLLRKYATGYEIYFNYDKAREACVRFVTEFSVDTFLPVLAAEGFIFAIAFSDYPDIAPIIRFWPGPMHDIIRDKYTKWPGIELPKDSIFQFIGGQFMEVEEYSKFSDDPVTFINEVVLPRACINLEKPGSPGANAALIKLGGEVPKFFKFLVDTNIDLAKAGIASLSLTSSYAPLDVIGDFLRGPTGALLDVRRYPDRVKQACEVLVEPIIKIALALKPAGAKYAFTPLHLNEYLSPKLYNEFYWPTLKKIIIDLYGQGIKSFIFFEGWHDAHLETILELPKGWGVAYFEKTDVRKAKKILGGHTCVMGGIPPSLLLEGTPDKIREHIRGLLKDMKPGGGFILSPGVGDLPKDVPPENIRALIEAVNEYGKY